jgi:Acetyltransferase (GNAT) domain
MLETTDSESPPHLEIYVRESVIDGKAVNLDCARINGQTYSITRDFVSVISLEDDWYEDVRDPASVIAVLNNSDNRADIFSFWQRLPEIEPRYPYQMQRDSIAALPVKSYAFWWEKQIERKTRNKVRKAQKQGVTVRMARFDDTFVRGMVSIFNEAPIRQGRRFLHYGKDFETIKRQFSRFLFREEIFGAYLNEELVGFIMLANAGKYALLGQIISKIAYRDVAPTNALLAKAVEHCAEKGFPYLVYAYWLDDTLGDFKRSNGFQKFDLPRYFVSLTRKGKLALKFGLHRGWKEAVPKQLRKPLKKVRRRWYGFALANGQ